jgi:hypothetical protein
MMTDSRKGQQDDKRASSRPLVPPPRATRGRWWDYLRLWWEGLD